MSNRTSLAAALAAISLAYAGVAAAQTDVLVVEGTKVGISSNVPTAPERAGDLAASRRDEQKYMEYRLTEALISNVGTPARSPGAHANEIHVESFSWGMNQSAAAGGVRQNAGATPQAVPFAVEKLGDLKGQGATPVLPGARAAGGPSMTGPRLPQHAPALAAPVGRR
jgi:type VI protein secretion system component Hcp